jgi:mannosyl-oligosaccharide alpha-1,2-mannosidase
LQVHKMDHLACFVPGMLVLGAQGDVAPRYLALAADLSDTCVQMYAGTATGLAPELVNFRDGRDMFTNDRSAHNLLRPETVESLFYLYRKTGDERYREQGWAIFTAFEAHCRLRGGYAGVKDVRQLPVRNDDTQQSFFLAETLKYLFLLFSDSDTINLEEWVFNTEAHPLRVVRRETSLLAEAEDASGAEAPEEAEAEAEAPAEAPADAPAPAARAPPRRARAPRAEDA